MLRITIEVLPQGDTRNAQKIGQMTIANDERGGYEYRVTADDLPIDGLRGKIISRVERLSPWHLVYAVLNEYWRV